MAGNWKLSFFLEISLSEKLLGVPCKIGFDLSYELMKAAFSSRAEESARFLCKLSVLRYEWW